VACYRPLTAWKLTTGEIVFAARRGQDHLAELSLPCGQCVGCRLERSRQWAIRCVHESQMHEHSLFVTLTYSDEHLPEDSSLDYRHFQLFMKRLRKHFVGTTIRFYMCGEYGDETLRPHYHACLFGVFFADRRKIGQSSDGSVLYTSHTLESLWGKGNVSFGDVTFESAGYVARYICKKVTGLRAAAHYEVVCPVTGEIFQRKPEFSQMSLKPGIGYSWFEKYKAEVYPLDRIVIRGREMKPPKYYDKLLELESNFLSDDLEYSRYQRAVMRKDDNTEARLAVREKCAKAKLSFKLRSLK